METLLYDDFHIHQSLHWQELGPFEPNDTS